MQRNSPGFERRRHPRYPVRTQNGLSRWEASPAEVLLVTMVDISEGGIRMVLEAQIQPGQVLKCELAVPELPVRIPTLTQARWCSEVSREHVCGLRFIV